MNCNHYSPVQVKDPTSENHIVTLHPGQEFLVSISTEMGAVEIDVDSRFFRLAQKEVKSDKVVFRFSQIYDLTPWSNVSRTYLGEVLILSDKYLSSLCVVLESLNPNKRDVIVAVNPEGGCLKLDVHNILEVVVYDSKLGDNDMWNCNIVSGDHQLKLEQIGHEISSSKEPIDGSIDSDNVYCILPRSIGGEPCREHHYWFRCDGPSIDILGELSSGTYSGGKIVFDGSSCTSSIKNYFFMLHLLVNVREKNRGKIYRGMLCPPKDQWGPRCYGASAPITTLAVNQQRSWEARARGNCRQRNVWLHPQVKKIKLKEKENSELGSGCRIAYFKKKKICY